MSRKYTLDEIIDEVERIIANDNHEDLCMCDAWPHKCEQFPYGVKTPFSTSVREVLETAFPLLMGEKD